MAHIAKYKAASCGHMLAHYRRDASSLGRENIDPTRTKDNYTLGLDDRDGKVRALNGIEPNWALMRPRKVQPTERSLDDVMRDATEVAKALSRNHVALTNSRTRGQAR